MAIVMIQGPDGAEGRTSGDGMQATLAARAARARTAGQDLVQYRCGSEQQLVNRLAEIDRGQADIILLDPGRGGGASAALCNALHQLKVPYIGCTRTATSVSNR